MTDLMVIAYRKQSQARHAITALHALQSAGWITIEDAAYLTVESAGRVCVHQDRALTQPGKETGPVWGVLLTILFSSLLQIMANVPKTGLAGALAYDVASSAMGVSSAISTQLSSYGFDAAFIHDLQTHLLLNNAAVFVMVRNITVDKVIAEMKKYGGTVLYTTFPYKILQRFQESLSQQSNQE